jgi:hypothetical protein
MTSRDTKCLLQLGSRKDPTSVSHGRGHWFEPSTAHQLEQKLPALLSNLFPAFRAVSARAFPAHRAQRLPSAQRSDQDQLVGLADSFRVVGRIRRCRIKPKKYDFMPDQSIFERTRAECGAMSPASRRLGGGTNA